MQWMRGDRSQKLDTLLNMLILLGALFIILATFTLLGDVLGLLDRFRSEIFLFLFGAILAYLIAPLVHALQRLLRVRWIAIVSAYLLLFLALLAVGFLLINPFISQARSLVDNLRNPSTTSLHGFTQVRATAKQVQKDLTAGAPVPKTQADIQSLQRAVAELESTRPAPGEIIIPPSYVDPIAAEVNRLASDYARAARAPGVNSLSRSLADVQEVSARIDTAYGKASSTPALMLSLQVWLDRHGIKVDLKDKFGKTLQQLSNQLASLVNNALGIALRAGNLLLNTVLALIISIYFLSDGGRLVRWLVRQVPAESRDQTQYLITRLDQILGTYLRAQILIALIAGVLDATGAVVLGVPYAIVIFFSSFLLSLVPVIGPVVLPIPPMLIALIFKPLPTAIAYLAWLLVGEQLATNVIGPRVQGHSVGIHPLEAMAAALIGFPLAGLLGAFFAVPIVAFFHVVVREIVRVRREGPPAQQSAQG